MFLLILGVLLDVDVLDIPLVHFHLCDLVAELFLLASHHLLLFLQPCFLLEMLIKVLNDLFWRLMVLFSDD